MDAPPTCSVLRSPSNLVTGAVKHTAYTVFLRCVHQLQVQRKYIYPYSLLAREKFYVAAREKFMLLYNYTSKLGAQY